MGTAKTRQRARFLALMAVLLLALSLGGCQNCPAQAHERASEPAVEAPAPAAPVAARTEGEKSALRRMDSFFNKPLGVPLIEK